MPRIAHVERRLGKATKSLPVVRTSAAIPVWRGSGGVGAWAAAWVSDGSARGGANSFVYGRVENAGASSSGSCPARAGAVPTCPTKKPRQDEAGAHHPTACPSLRWSDPAR